MMTAPKISDFMTASPHLIGAEQSLARAHDVMRKNDLRHLPVLHGGKLVGLVSRGDLHLVETMPDVDAEKVSVEEAMSRDVYGVGPDELLLSVVREMTTRKLGSAVILAHGKVVGIFTVIDALRVLDKALEALLRGDTKLD
jgi:acetoin utilization protein AcuB